jgi:hypothetical protein
MQLLFADGAVGPRSKRIGFSENFELLYYGDKDCLRKEAGFGIQESWEGLTTGKFGVDKTKEGGIITD